MENEVKDSAINSLILDGISSKIPFIDIFINLYKKLKGIKKISLTHHPITYTSNNHKCKLYFNNHESYLIAKEQLKSSSILSNIFPENGSEIKVLECTQLRNDLINEVVNQTTALMFENMQINNYNIAEFYSYLNQYILNSEKNMNCKITKIRQYSNRVLVIFDSVPNCLKKFVRKGENEYTEDIPYFDYKGKNIPVIPKMKPIVNLGKYKERNIKLSMNNLRKEDREELINILKNKKNEFSKMEELADKAYNNIFNKEKNNLRDIGKKNNIINKKRTRPHSQESPESSIDKGSDRMRGKKKDNNDRDIKRDKIRDRNYSYNDVDNYNNNRNDNSNNNIYANLNSDKININGLNINKNDVEEVASIFSNKNAMLLVKYLLDNANNNNNLNNINNINNINNNQNNNNNSNRKNNYNNNYNNNIFNNEQNLNNNTNINNTNNTNQQLLNYIQSQGVNNLVGSSNINSNFQNLMNLNSVINPNNNNLINPNYYNNSNNNQRAFQYTMNNQYMNQFPFSQPLKGKDNEKNK